MCIYIWSFKCRVRYCDMWCCMVPIASVHNAWSGNKIPMHEFHIGNHCMHVYNVILKLIWLLLLCKTWYTRTSHASKHIRWEWLVLHRIQHLHHILFHFNKANFYIPQLMTSMSWWWNKIQLFKSCYHAYIVRNLSLTFHTLTSFK